MDKILSLQAVQGGGILMGVEDTVFPSHPSQGKLVWKTRTSKLKTTPTRLTKRHEHSSPHSVVS